MKLWEAAADASQVGTKKLSIEQKAPQWVRTLAGFHAAPYLSRYPIDVSMVSSAPNHEDFTGKLRALLAEVEAAFP